MSVSGKSQPAAQVFASNVRAEIFSCASQNHARAGRGTLFVKPMPDGSSDLDSQYFRFCELTALGILNEVAGCDLVALVTDRILTYDPAKQCVLFWMDEAGTAH